MNSTQIIRTAILSTMLASPMALAQSSVDDRGFSGDAKDAWITGKIETVMTLNPALNPFAIDTDVENGMVTLSGQVESDIDKDLAEELARGIDGVEQVENNLTIDPNGTNRYDERNTTVAGTRGNSADRDIDDDDRNEVAQWISDTTISAIVKSKLLANDNTEGLQFDVDTMNNVVTLTGEVKSDAEKQLAEEIARNSGDVHHVENNLRVNPAG